MKRVKKLPTKRIIICFSAVVLVILVVCVSAFLYVSYNNALLNSGYLYIEIDLETYEYDLKNKKYKLIEDEKERQFFNFVPYDGGYYKIVREKETNNNETDAYIEYSKNNNTKSYKVDSNTSDILFVNDKYVIYKSSASFKSDGNIYCLNIDNEKIINICDYTENYGCVNNFFVYANSKNKIYTIDMTDEDIHAKNICDGKPNFLNYNRLIYENNGQIYEYDFSSERSIKLNKKDYKTNVPMNCDLFRFFELENQVYTSFYYDLRLFEAKEDEAGYDFSVSLFRDLFIKSGNKYMRLKTRAEVPNSEYAIVYGYSEKSVLAG